MIQFVRVFALAILIANANGRAVGLADLPSELQNLLISKLPIADILRVCSTSIAMHTLCSNHEGNLWMLLLDRDFGDKPFFKPSASDGITPKEAYMKNYRLSLENKRYLKQNKTLKRNMYSLVVEEKDRFIVGANLAKADLASADLQYVYLSKVNFTGANCKGAKFGYQNLDGANFSGANLSGARFRFALTYVNATFKNANLEKAIFLVPGSTFTGADFSGANLIGAVYGNSEGDQGTPITLAWLKEKGVTWDEQNPPKVE